MGGQPSHNLPTPSTQPAAPVVASAALSNAPPPSVVASALTASQASHTSAGLIATDAFTSQPLDSHYHPLHMHGPVAHSPYLAFGIPASHSASSSQAVSSVSQSPTTPHMHSAASLSSSTAGLLLPPQPQAPAHVTAPPPAAPPASLSTSQQIANEAPEASLNLSDFILGEVICTPLPCVGVRGACYSTLTQTLTMH